MSERLIEVALIDIHTGYGSCELPRGARVLSAASLKGSKLTITALADPAGPLVLRRFALLSVGDDAQYAMQPWARFVGRVDAMELRGQTWHVFELPEGYRGTI